MTYLKKIMTGTFIVLLVNIMSFVLGYLLRFILARKLTVDEFGLFYAVLAFVGIFNLFRSFGLETALTKFVSEHNAKNNVFAIKSSIALVFILKVLISLFVFVVLLLSTSFLSVYYFKTPLASPVFILILISFLFSLFLDIFSSVFLGLNRMLLYALIEFLRNSFVIIFSLILFAFGFGVVAPAFGYMIAPILITLIVLFCFRKNLKDFLSIKKHLNVKLFRNIFSFSSLIFLSSVGSIIIGYTDTLTLTYFRTLSEVGFYNVALPTANILMFFSLSFGMVLFPSVSEMFAKRKFDMIKEGIELFYKNILYLILPLFVLMICFGSVIITVLYGEAYVSATISLIVLAIGFLFYSMANINLVFLNGINKPQISTKIMLFSACLNLILNLILVPRFGIVGASLSTSISFFSIFVFSFIGLIGQIKFELPIMIWIKQALLTVIFYFFVVFLKSSLLFFSYFNPYLRIGIILLLSCFIYLLCGILLKLETIPFLLNIVKSNYIKRTK